MARPIKPTYSAKLFREMMNVAHDSAVVKMMQEYRKGYFEVTE